MASFDENGKYIKTNWKAGDKITATKLNKIEESIEAVNDNDISRHVEADARLDALEAKDVAHDKEFTNVKNLIADNKAAAELGDYEINSRMTFLENELNEGIEEVHNVAETVDGKIAQAEANMEAMVAEVEADLEGLHAKDEELSAQLAHIENGVTDIVLNVKMFGVYGNGEDETNTIQNIIENAPIGSTILFPAGCSFSFSSLNINKHIIINSVGATLTQSTNQGTFININSDNVKICGGNYIVKGNNGISANGDNNSICSIRVDGGEHGILVRGNNCIVEDCISENANYAGFKINFSGGDKRDCVTIRNCISKNFKFKGIVYNGTVGTKKIIIEKFTGKTDTRESASDNILVDCGDDTIFCVDEVIVNDAFLYGGEANSMKIFNTNNLILKNIYARNGHSKYSSSSGLRIYAEKSYLKNINIDNRIVTGSSIQIENLYASKGDSDIAHVLELNGSGTIATLNNINIDVNWVASVIRVDRNSGVNHKIILNNYYSSDKNLLIFGVYTAPPNPVGYIEIHDNKLLEGYKITGSSGRDNMIIRSPRTFISTTCPTSGEYIKGDIIYNSNIISGGNLGWICIQSKTDSSNPVFKAFGTIEK